MSQLATRVRQRARDLYETLGHLRTGRLLCLQEKALELREIQDPGVAYNRLYELLNGYLKLGSMTISLRSPVDGNFTVSFHRQSSSSTVSTPTSTDPFSGEERKQILESGAPILRALEKDRSHTTAILAPLSLCEEKIGVVSLLLHNPLESLQGFRLQVVKYLLKELSALLNQRRLDDSVHSLKTLNRGVIESIGHGLIAVDRHGNILCHNLAARIFQRTESASGHIQDFLAQDLVAPVSAMLKELEQGRSHEAVAIEFTAQDGQVYPLTISSTPLELQGENQAGWVFMIKDSTHSIEVEHLKKYEALKSEFLVGLIHDMKTPLTGIMSGCEILLENTPNLGAEETDTIQIIHAIADRLQEQASDSLELSALESASTDDPMEPADMGAVLSSTLDELRLTSSQHEIHFDSPHESLILYCQPRRISRVLQNLIGNAVKYSPEGGKIEVSLSRDENCARVAVTDEGIGIHNKQLPSIWKRFHRIPGQEVSEIEGTGLGLSIIKMIVDKHHGRVTVESDPGKGSTFAVYLPLLKKPQKVSKSVFQWHSRPERVPTLK